MNVRFQTNETLALSYYHKASSSYLKFYPLAVDTTALID
jgi:hypothetical protein